MMTTARSRRLTESLNISQLQVYSLYSLHYLRISVLAVWARVYPNATASSCCACMCHRPAHANLCGCCPADGAFMGIVPIDRRPPNDAAGLLTTWCQQCWPAGRALRRICQRTSALRASSSKPIARARGSTSSQTSTGNGAVPNRWLPQGV